MVYDGTGKDRLTALNVVPSWKAVSPAYSSRTSVGVSTSKRALPSTTTEDAAEAAGAEATPAINSPASRPEPAKAASSLLAAVGRGGRRRNSPPRAVSRNGLGTQA